MTQLRRTFGVFLTGGERHRTGGAGPVTPAWQRPAYKND